MTKEEFQALSIGDSVILDYPSETVMQKIIASSDPDHRKLAQIVRNLTPVRIKRFPLGSTLMLEEFPGILFSRDWVRGCECADDFTPATDAELIALIS